MSARAERIEFVGTLDILAALRWQFGKRDVFEVRALGLPQGPQCGFFRSHVAAVRAAKQAEAAGACAIYISLNPVKGDLHARAADRLKPARAGGATSDDLIERRTSLLVDVDPIRLSDISATDAEVQAAREVTDRVRRYLQERGFPDPQIRFSGNGYALVYPCDLLNDDDGATLVKRFLGALDARFGTENVKIDTSVYNASRLTRLPGTMNRKGDDVPERPHRRASVRITPAAHVLIERATIEALAAHCPAETEPPPYDHGRRFDLEAFIREHFSLKRVGPYRGGRKFILAVCPFHETPDDSSVAIIEGADGRIGWACLHDRCAGRHWSDVREGFEPGYRDRREPLRDSKPVDGSPARPEPPPFVRAATLLAESADDDIAYVVRELLLLGGTAILAGRPKGGKTTLALNGALAVVRGQLFFGRTTRKGAVLYVALEGARGAIKQLLRALGVNDEDELFCYIGRTPEGALQWLRDAIEKYQPVLVIVDTMQRLLRVRDANDYATGSNVTDAVIELARNANACLLLLHHSGKTRHAEIVDEVMGSTAWAAAVDTVLVLRKGARFRTLQSEGRVGENLPETLVEMDPTTRAVKAAGTKTDVDLAEMCEAIARYLKEYAEGHADAPAVEEHVIHAAAEGRTGVKYEALRELVTAGRVHRSGDGKKGDPYRYQDSASLLPAYSQEGEKENPKGAKNPEGIRVNAASGSFRENGSPSRRENGRETTSHAGEEDTAEEGRPQPAAGVPLIDPPPAGFCFVCKQVPATFEGVVCQGCVEGRLSEAEVVVCALYVARERVQLSIPTPEDLRLLALSARGIAPPSADDLFGYANERIGLAGDQPDSVRK